jgi:hypothetical protein
MAAAKDLKPIVEQLFKARFHERTKVTIQPPLYKQGIFLDGQELDVHLCWDQTIEEQYRAGFNLYQPLMVSEGPDKGKRGYAMAFHPYKSLGYTLVFLADRTDKWAVRFGVPSTKLIPLPTNLKVEDNPISSIMNKENARG